MSRVLPYEASDMEEEKIDRRRIMPRETKDQKINRLQAMLDSYKEYTMRVDKRIAELVQAEEGSFLHSPTYIQMKEELAFVKNLNELNEIHLNRKDIEIQRLRTLLAEKTAGKQSAEQKSVEDNASNERESVILRLQDAQKDVAAGPSDMNERCKVRTNAEILK